MLNFVKKLFAVDHIELIDRQNFYWVGLIRLWLQPSDTIVYLGHIQFSAVAGMQLLGTEFPADGLEDQYSLSFMGRTIIPVNRNSFIGRNSSVGMEPLPMPLETFGGGGEAFQEKESLRRECAPSRFLMPEAEKSIPAP